MVCVSVCGRVFVCVYINIIISTKYPDSFFLSSIYMCIYTSYTY